MRAARVANFGEPEVIVEEQDVEIPVPSSSEVLIRVKAAGINPVDAYIRSGTYPRLPPLPYTPGSDCSGVIECVGNSVVKFKPGDSVWTHQSISGSYAQFSLAHEDAVFFLPEELDFEQGAALGIPYMTAYRALVHKARVQSGETVLVNGASGGVGIAGVQIAKALGCRVIGTAGTTKGISIVKDAGADEAYDRRSPNYLQNITNAAHGIDVILEMAANINLGTDLTVLSPGGRVILIGSRGSVDINPRDAMVREATIIGLLMFKATSEEIKETSIKISNWSHEGWVRPMIGKRYTLAEAKDAHKDIMQCKGAQGRIILTME